MKIKDLTVMNEAPEIDPVKAAQDSLQKAKEGVVALQNQMSQLAAQKKAADEQVRAAQQAVSTAQRMKSQQRTQPTPPTQPTQPGNNTMGAPNQTGSASI